MRFRNLYIKKRVKLKLWLNFKKIYYNSFFLNYFLNYFLIFNFNSFKMFNWNLFKNLLNFFGVNIFKLNNSSKLFFLALLTNMNFFNKLGNLFFINFLNLYCFFDFILELNTVLKNSVMSRFIILFNNIGKNFLKNKFFLKQFFFIMEAKNSLKLIISFLKILIKHYLCRIFLILFNYLNFFSFFFSLMIKKCFFNVNNTSGR